MDFLANRWKFPKGIAALLPLFLFVVIVGCAVYFLGKILLEQMGHFLEAMPQYQEMLYEKVQYICQYCDGLMNVKQGTSWDTAYLKLASSAEDIQDKMLGNLTTKTWKTLKNTAGLFGTIGIMLIFVYMLLKDKEYYERAYKQKSA